MSRLKDRGTRTLLAVSFAALLAGQLLKPVPGRAADEPADNLAQFYGFGRLELYKLQQRSGNMLAADLNSDGRTDLVLIDNSNSRLDILQQREKPDAAGRPAGSGKINA